MKPMTKKPLPKIEAPDGSSAIIRYAAFAMDIQRRVKIKKNAQSALSWNMCVGIKKRLKCGNTGGKYNQ